MNNATLSDSEVRTVLLEVFEDTRETPGAYFNPEKFIHYLVANTDGKRNVHNSFKGKRHFVRFIKRIEMRFGVCFSNKDLDTIVGMSEMADRIAAIYRTPKSSLTVIANRLKEPFNQNIVIAIVVVSIPVISVFYKLFSHVGLAAFGLPILAITLVVRLHRRERRHYETLRQHILKASN